MNKIKASLLAIVAFFLGFNATAQDITMNKEIMKKVMADYENYLFATAVADSFDLAVKDAVGLLANQIMTDVRSETNSTIYSESHGQEVAETTLFSQVLKTFTDVRLTDYNVLMVGKPEKKNKTYSAFVYISADKVREILDDVEQKEQEAAKERRAKLEQDLNFYYDEGQRAVKDLRIGDALKYYYWGYILALDTDLKIERDTWSQPAASLFESLLDRTLSNIKTECVGSTTEQVNEFQSIYKKLLSFQYLTGTGYQKITCLDFQYHNGNTYVGGARVRDGVSVAELSYDLNDIKVHYVYNYDENETPPQIYELIRSKRKKSFSSADQFVDAHAPEMTLQPTETEKDTTAAEEAVPDADEVVEENTPKNDDLQRYEHLNDIMIEVEDAIQNKRYDQVSAYFTADGLDSFNKLVKYGKASILGTQQYQYIPFGDLILCRSMTMQFRFRNNKQFVENVTFRFNQDDLIESLAFTLSDVAQHEILDEGDWSERSRLTLLSFMEDYQTAYALGRIDYLEKIFSEYALIITGYKVMKKVDSDGLRLQGYTRYDTLSKSQYMDRLRRHFKTREYINLNFTDTEFDQAYNVKDFFGVRVRQEYFSSTYGDVGYLFLLVDLRGKDPVIHVRAWQDDKIPLKELFSLKDVY